MTKLFAILALTVAAAVTLGGCGTDTVGRPKDGGSGNADLAFNFGDGSVPTTCDDQHPCPAGQRCYGSMCIPDNGTCTTDNDCQNDTYCVCTQGGGMDMGACMGGVCVPWGDPPNGLFDPDCHGQGFSASQFQPPVQKCHWSSQDGNSNVIVTPIVVDLDKDGKPEIVFQTYSSPGPTKLVAIHGDTCQELWNKSFTGLDGRKQIAAADLDGDGYPELVTGASSGAGVLVIDHNGNLLASGGAAINFLDCGGPAIADVDGDGKPEIGFGGTVFRYTKGNTSLQQLWTQSVTGGHWGIMSLFADMDGDGHPELVSGLQVYDGRTGADKAPSNLKAITGPGAYPAIADFNMDGKPDIVLVQSESGQQKVEVFDYANNKIIFGPYTVADGGWGGTPTVGDYDGDGVPDFGLASSSYYYVYALKCAQSPKPADCTGTDPGVLWQRKTHDLSSGGTGSSTFDFNGDGLNEVVYRDECWFRVYSGKDGKTVFAQAISSGTLLEYPVIADVDNDGHADVVVPSDNLGGDSYCAGVPEGQTGQVFSTATSGIFVLTDPMNRWVPSRPLWTAHTYHITEINDDYTVPASESPNWKTWNNYRKNVQGAVGKPLPLDDLTGAAPMSIDNGGLDCNVAERLWAQICNRGSAPSAAGIPGTFYTSDPRLGNATKICTATTTMSLQPGQCEAVHCDWMNPPQNPVDLWFRADDDGTKSNVTAECNNGNDLLFLAQVACMKIG